MFQKKHSDLKCDLKFEISAKAKITITNCYVLFTDSMAWYEIETYIQDTFLQMKLVNGFGNLDTPRDLF